MIDKKCFFLNETHFWFPTRVEYHVYLMLGRCANLHTHEIRRRKCQRLTTWHSICAYTNSTHIWEHEHVHNTSEELREEIIDSKYDREGEKMLKKLNEVYGLFSSIYFPESLLLYFFVFVLCLSIQVTDNNKFLTIFVRSACVWNLRWLIQKMPKNVSHVL